MGRLQLVLPICDGQQPLMLMGLNLDPPWRAASACLADRSGAKRSSTLWVVSWHGRTFPQQIRGRSVLRDDASQAADNEGWLDQSW